MEEKERIMYGNPLTKKSIIVTSIFLVLTPVLSNFSHLYASRGLISSFMFPFFYLALFNVLLGKINPKFKLNGPEMTLLVTCWMFLLGQQMQGNIESINYFSEVTFFASGYVLMDPALKASFMNWVPSYMFPKSDLALSAFYNGLQPGQSWPWGEYVAPTIYWTVYVTLMFAWIWFLAIALWGKRFVEVENLPFPTAVPFLYTVEASLDVDKETNKSRWLSLRSTGYRIFWITFAVGVVLAAFPIIQQYVPTAAIGPIGADYGEVAFNMPLASVIPEAHWRSIFMMDQFALWLLLPINSLATIVLQWLVVEVIWLSVAVQAGIVPYVPGGEYQWGPPQEWQYPFPYGPTWQGAFIGVGIITLWTLRGRFKELYNSLRGQDKTELGLSVRSITIFGIIIALALLGFFVGSGVPLIIALIMMGMSLISYTALAKVGSIFWLHIGDFSNLGGQSYWWYPGAVLGYWPLRPDISTQTYAAFATASLQNPFNYSGDLRCHGFAPAGVTGIYKIAYETKTNMKQLLIGALMVIIVAMPISYVSYIWLINHAGGVPRTNSWGSWAGTSKYNNGFLRVPLRITGETRYEAIFPWHLLGMAIVFITFVMRMKFAWFWIDPVAMAYSLPYMAWHWGVALAALVVKVVLIRVIGATKFNNYARHMASGLVAGYVAPVLVAWLIEFSTAMIPNFQGLYVP